MNEVVTLHLIKLIHNQSPKARNYFYRLFFTDKTNVLVSDITDIKVTVL